MKDLFGNDPQHAEKLRVWNAYVRNLHPDGTYIDHTKGNRLCQEYAALVGPDLPSLFEFRPVFK